jgi:cell division inhibitor SepF
MEKLREIWTPPEDEYEEDEGGKGSEEVYKMKNHDTREDKNSQNENKVLSMHSGNKLQVVLFKPEHFGEEIKAAADELTKMHTVVLNLEDAPKEAFRRTLDFLSGVAYANSGKISKIATKTFIIAPYNVDFMGNDLLDELENNGVCF